MSLVMPSRVTREAIHFTRSAVVMSGTVSPLNRAPGKARNNTASASVRLDVDQLAEWHPDQGRRRVRRGTGRGHRHPASARAGSRLGGPRQPFRTER